DHVAAEMDAVPLDAGVMPVSAAVSKYSGPSFLSSAIVRSAERFGIFRYRWQNSAQLGAKVRYVFSSRNLRTQSAWAAMQRPEIIPNARRCPTRTPISSRAC